jgi:uncharacterized OsmC-like protein
MEMKIAYRSGKKFIATCRGKQMVIDQPLESNGTDAGMTPPEAFIVSLGSCMGIYVLNYCKRAKINPSDMILSMEWSKDKNPARISKIKVEIKLPKGEIKNRSDAILKTANHCLVHQTLLQPPELEIKLVE